MNTTSKYLLVEPKTKAIAPNIALMKWAKWASLQGHEYQYVRGMVYPKIKPDEILMSCIFSYNSRLYEETINHYLRLFPDAKVTVGGVFPSLNPEWFNRWNGAFTVHKEWEPVNGAGLVDFVISLNLTRRHLTPSQKAQ